MHPYAEFDGAATLASLVLQRSQSAAGASGGFERERTGLRPSIIVGGKEGEDGVAYNIEHLTALFHYGSGGAIEIGVEQVEKGIDRELIGKACRVPQVAIPERGR